MTAHASGLAVMVSTTALSPGANLSGRKERGEQEKGGSRRTHGVSV